MCFICSPVSSNSIWVLLFLKLNYFPGRTLTLALSPECNHFHCKNVRSEKLKWESDYWNSTPQLSYEPAPIRGLHEVTWPIGGLINASPPLPRSIFRCNSSHFFQFKQGFIDSKSTHSLKLCRYCWVMAGIIDFIFLPEECRPACAARGRAGWGAHSTCPRAWPPPSWCTWMSAPGPRSWPPSPRRCSPSRGTLQWSDVRCQGQMSGCHPVTDTGHSVITGLCEA